MVLKNSLNFINGFFFYIGNQLRKFYLNSTFYNNKISKIDEKVLDYKPSLSILNCIIKYEKKKNNIEDFYLNSIWENNNLKTKDYKKLHNFFWLFTLDLKSSKKITQSIILNWLEKNHSYNSKNWEIDTLSKRIISWLSNTKLTYEESNESFKQKFNFIVKKQINHLINEINRSESVDDKIIGCAAIILSGLSYKDEKFLKNGLNLLKKIINYSFDNTGFPKSRSLRQLVFYLKYFILIREFLKESQNEIPNYLDEIIFNLGQAYNLLNQSKNITYLFNGNHVSNNSDFNDYLKFRGYKFKSHSNEFGGYALLKNKNSSICIDFGQAPEKKFSANYQAGCLSFEFTYSDNKLICNSGYFQNFKHQLNSISKSTASHSTLILDNSSICKFKKNNSGNYLINKSYKIFNKKIINEKNYWNLTAAHDGYQKKYGVIHQREIEFYPEKNKIIGKDHLIKKKNFKSTNFEIRFHFLSNSKITKTKDGNAILIELKGSGWKFTSENHLIDIETGLYFGNKNSFTENQNIFISGQTQKNDQTIVWKIEKI